VRTCGIREKRALSLRHTRSGEGVTTPKGTVTAFLWQFWHVQSRVQPRLWRREMGKLRLRERLEQRSLSRPGRVCCISTTRQSREPIRPCGFSALQSRLHSRESGLHTFHGSRIPIASITFPHGPDRPVGNPLGPTDQVSQIKTLMSHRPGRESSATTRSSRWCFCSPGSIQLLSESQPVR